MAYYTLVSRETFADDWAIEFGDYDKETVQEEMREIRYSAHMRGDKLEAKIIRTTSARQSEINAAVEALNGRNCDLTETPVRD